jgi:L-threonylcarbamoyladenylate synthase
VGWVTFAVGQGQPARGALVVALPQEPAVWAARLYAVLHDLDQAGVDGIVVDLPPPADEWLAVRDRLRRASNP